MRNPFRKRNLSFSLYYSDKAVENLIFHLNRILRLTLNGEFYREEGGINCGQIFRKPGGEWNELAINITDFIFLPNRQENERLYSSERRKVLSILRRVYHEKRNIYIGEWHVHISGIAETSRQDDLNLIGKLRWQKYIMLLIVTKINLKGGAVKYRVTPYLYFRRWFKRFKWKLDFLDIMVPKPGLKWRYLLDYSGNKEVKF